MTGIGITNRFRSALFKGHIILLPLFGMAPHPQQALQIGTAACVATLPDVMDQMACDAVSILLSGLRSAFSGSLGIQSAAISANDLNRGAFLQPCFCALYAAVVQNQAGPAGGDCAGRAGTGFAFRNQGKCQLDLRRRKQPNALYLEG